MFNEYGVQIMSPHYMADTPTPQAVAQSGRWPSPVRLPREPERG
ncbi:MAG: hypothetical protein Q8M64_04195 [Methyloversatilis sp.]|nr:hypothetical protein [Methyloversatilis sp.]